MERRRPRGRDTSGMGHTFSGKTGRRGDGLGTGPVGNTGGMSGGGSSGGSGNTGDDKGLLSSLAGQVLGGGNSSSGSGLGSLLGGGSSTSSSGSGLGSMLGNMASAASQGTTTSSGGGFKISRLVIILAICGVIAALGASCAGINASSGLSNLLSSSTGGDTTLFGGNSTTSTGWTDNASNVFSLDTSVAEGSRSKYTTILGNNQDKVTVMVYMCGSDLESNSAMATKDLQEMAAADLSDNVNVIVFTGGASRWNNNVISNKVNQVYRVTKGGLERLVDDAGTGAMSDPATLSAFIKWTKEKYPANRNQLILWDHGGGSLSGFGYDEKNSGRGYMSLAEINTALSDAGMKFDFIGFDACLMATAENGLMLEKYADYLIASEETEPGIGWYYTNWLNKISEDSSIPTTSLGKVIVDDFTSECAANTPGQKTTLSLVDLAELANTVPSKLSAFSKSVSTKIANKEYSAVSSARNNTREFARSTYIDQVDLVNLAQNMGTDEGKELAEAIKGAVKYNRTSSNMTDAYGVSVYFPYSRVNKVDTAVKTYSAIGMDSDYTKCIQEFANLEATGQISTGGSGSALTSLFDIFGGGSGGYSFGGDSSSLLNSFLGGGRQVDGLSKDKVNFLSDKVFSNAAATSYVDANRFDATKLTWHRDEDGNYLIKLSDEQWELVNSLDMNMFLDDGEGYIDLGLDNVYEYNEDLDMVADTSKRWIGVNGQTVAYYREDTVDNGAGNITTGYIPALLNGKRVKLIVSFDSVYPEGIISGIEYVYENEDVPQGKIDPEFKEGDKIDFLCDYYSYDKKYNDSYMLGEQLVVGEEGLEITAQDMSEERILETYLFTDIYNNRYWTPAIIL